MAALRSAEGFYDPRTGKTVIITGNVGLRPGETPQSALTRVMLHERVGHDGLGLLLNAPEDRPGQLNINRLRWENLVRGMPQHLLEGIANEPGYEHLKGNQQALALEWFAREAEEHPELLTRGSLVMRMWDNFKQGVVDLMLRLGLEPLKGQELDAQVMTLLQRARQAAVEGRTTQGEAAKGPAGQGLQFSMGGAPDARGGTSSAVPPTTGKASSGTQARSITPPTYNKTHEDSKPVPKGVGLNGGGMQSHHGLQHEWALHNLSQYGYKGGKAPTITIETGTSLQHTIITNLQRARRNARKAAGKGLWSSSLQEELGYIVSDLTAAGFDRDVIGKTLEQQYRMLDKLGVPYQRVKY